MYCHVHVDASSNSLVYFLPWIVADEDPHEPFLPPKSICSTLIISWWPIGAAMFHEQVTPAKYRFGKFCELKNQSFQISPDLLKTIWTICQK